jgi:2-dehydro-3-deoxyglucarate aldolase
MRDPIIAFNKLTSLREKLSSHKPSIGSWVQLPCPITTELIASAGYDWIAVDLEHGAINLSDIDNLVRCIDIAETISLVRLPDHSIAVAKKCMDAGFYGVIVPNIRNKYELRDIAQNLSWPPAGTRGVGFCMANTFGAYFDTYKVFSQRPFLVPMIESEEGVDNLLEILSLRPDAVLVGPYDLSASLGIVGQFDHPRYTSAIHHIFSQCSASSIPFGLHQVSPDVDALHRLIDSGCLFIPYSIDTVFFSSSTRNPLSQ